MLRVQLCTKDDAGLYKTIRDIRMDVRHKGTIFWICESYARLENPSACSQLHAFQLVPSPDLTPSLQFHQIHIEPSMLIDRVRTCHVLTVPPPSLRLVSVRDA